MQVAIIRGLPGSGKSTYAHRLALQWGAVIVEQDQFRVRDYKYVFKTEDDVHKSFLDVIQTYAKWGADIIITGTFVTNKSVERVLDKVESILQDEYGVDTDLIKIEAGYYGESFCCEELKLY